MENGCALLDTTDNNGIEPCTVGTADIGGNEDLTTHVIIVDALKSVGLKCGVDAAEHLANVTGDESNDTANNTNCSVDKNLNSVAKV